MHFNESRRLFWIQDFSMAVCISICGSLHILVLLLVHTGVVSLCLYRNCKTLVNIIPTQCWISIQIPFFCCFRTHQLFLLHLTTRKCHEWKKIYTLKTVFHILHQVRGWRFANIPIYSHTRARRFPSFFLLQNFLFFSQDVDDCNPDPCVNAYSCTDEPYNYTCVCIDGWSGKDCDVPSIFFFTWKCKTKNLIPQQRYFKIESACDKYPICHIAYLNQNMHIIALSYN